MKFDLSMATKLFKDMYLRKHTIYEVGFIKYRREQKKEFTRKHEAIRLFKKYKNLYKSAYFYTNYPPLKILNLKDVMSDLIKRNRV